MYAHFPRKRTCVGTMMHRPMKPNSQKEDNKRFSVHHRKHSQALCSSRSPRSPPSLRHHRWISLRSLPRNFSPHASCQDDTMIIISPALRQWLHEKGFEGYIRVAEAPPHPDAHEVAKKLNVRTKSKR